MVSLKLCLLSLVPFPDAHTGVSFSVLGFTDEPEDLRGFPVHTCIFKGPRGFGFNIVGGTGPHEFLQVYSVTSDGPSALKTGDDM